MALLSANILVCERILVEKDQVPTLVRVVDLFFVSPETPKSPDGKLPPMAMSLYASVVLTADDDDEHEVSIDLVRPDGSISPINTTKQKTAPSRLEHTHRTMLFAVQVGVNPTHHGDHEVRLTFDGEKAASAWFAISLNAAPPATPTTTKPN